MFKKKNKDLKFTKNRKEKCSEEDLMMSMINEMEEYQESVINKLVNTDTDSVFDYLEENGFVSEDGHIKTLGDANASAAIPAVAFSYNDDYESTSLIMSNAVIIPTINGGMRFMSPSKNGKYTEDLGEVTVPCIIGTVEKPTGFYIPFNADNIINPAVTDLIPYKDIISNL